MIKEVEEYKSLMLVNFEIDDVQAIDILIAVAVSHKIPQSEMLWLRIIGASGSGKTEILRTLAAQDGYCVSIESITPAAIRRGYSFKKGEIPSQPLLERLNGALVVTKEFSVILTKDADTQKEIFGLLRGVHDGSLDSDYGSEQGHLHQESHFDWILGTTIYVERQRHLETLLGSRFIDLRWGRPIEYETAVVKAVSNDGGLSEIRQRLSQAMADIIINTASYPKPSLPYLPEFADLAARLRTPVERNTRTNEIYEIPDIELGTRFGQSLMRIARGLLMIGVPVQELRPYLNRMVMDCMSKIRAGVVGCLLKDITKQEDIAHKTNLSRGYVARILEELRLLGVTSEKLKILGDDGVDVEHRGEEI